MTHTTILPLVLLVDDAPDVHHIAEILCHRSGIELRSELDGGAAWEWLQSTSRPPDLLLLDINLPGESGLDLYDRLQASDAHCQSRAALFSQSSQSSTIAEGIRRGIRYLVKKELLTDFDGWPERIKEIIDFEEPVSEELFRETAVPSSNAQAVAVSTAVQGLSLSPALRSLGKEVLSALFSQTLTYLRKLPGESSLLPDEVSPRSEKEPLQEVISLLEACPRISGALTRVLCFFLECLLGTGASDAAREPLLSALR